MYRIKLFCCGAVAELADAEDLKSSGGDTLWVQVPLAPLTTIYGGIMVKETAHVVVHPKLRRIRHGKHHK
jgi:alanine-alpha-ketoisovalerate/valine-pyruvate aminotransferase